VDEEREGCLFPEGNSDARILCHDMTPEFLIFGTDVCTVFIIRQLQFTFTYFGHFSLQRADETVLLYSNYLFSNFSILDII